MKFWQKIFIGTLIIFMLFFSVGAFVLTTYTYNFNKQREVETALREHSIIALMLSGRISNIEQNYPDVAHNKERLVSIMYPVADYYGQQGGLFALFSGGEEAFSNIPGLDMRLLAFEDARGTNTMDAIVGGKRHILVASRVAGYPGLAFVYARDISQVDNFQSDVSRVFVATNAAVLALIGATVYLMLKYITRPITKLNKAADKIANGAYGERVEIDSGDEFGQLGRNFNLMADSVESNITSLVKMAEEKQEFINDLTHEIKTPMTSILGYAEYLQHAKCSNEERMAATENLHKAALQMKNLSEKLLELILLRNEKIELEPVDIASLFEDLASLMKPSLRARNLALELDAGAAYVNGDKTLLLSMLANLVENAAGASRPESAIAVRACEKDGVVLEVADTGHGMDEEEIEKIASPFYRIDKSRSRSNGGIGLGLSIVSQIASLHGAEMRIESMPGKGTKARILFTTQ